MFNAVLHLIINRDKSMKSKKSPLDEDCGVLAYVKVSNKGLDDAIRDWGVRSQSA